MTAIAIEIAGHASVTHPNTSNHSFRLAPPSRNSTDQTLRRPDSGVLNEEIPVYFVGRNQDGFWVARDAGDSIGGLFLLKASAFAFARRESLPAGCAIVLLSERFELDVANKGNPLIPLIGSIKRRMRPASLAAPR